MAVAGLPAACGADAQALAAALASDGQEHLFAGWGALGPERDADKLRLLAQLAQLDGAYPGGLLVYLDRARELLAQSARGENPFAGYTPRPPRCERFAFGCTDERLVEAERAGRAAFGKAACVLVAGGLGERLGYSGIKVALPSELSSGTCFLALYCKYILALQGDAQVPLVIMTSDDTHAATQALLEREAYFGLAAAQVRLLKQEKVAALADADARLALAAGDQFRVVTKPHGHGDVHMLLHQHGLVQAWAERGLEWVLFFQDTNPMSFRTLPAALGVSAAQGLDVNSVAIPRKAKAAAGAIMTLEHEDGHEVTTNVEYNYIDGLLRATLGQGDVNGADGYSPFPGNMNQLVFRLPPYAAGLQRTQGVVPEFVNPKYADAEARQAFKSPTRLECMMQDYPLTLKGSAAAVGVTVFDDAQTERPPRSLTHRLYAPCKNALRDAAAKFAKGVPDASATSTELAIYACNALMLRDIGCGVEDAAPRAWGGMEQPEWAHVVLLPAFAPLLSDLPKRFERPELVRVLRGATLVLEGDVTFEGELALDGALVVRACEGARVRVTAAHVRNLGCAFAPVDPDDEAEDEVHRIRGFKIQPPQALAASEDSPHACVRRFDRPGDYTVRIEHVAAAL